MQMQLYPWHKGETLYLLSFQYGPEDKNLVHLIYKKDSQELSIFEGHHCHRLRKKYKFKFEENEKLNTMILIKVNR